MRVETAGFLRRIDLAPTPDLMPALRDEWANLRFAPDGSAINPMTEEKVDHVVLVGGRHGHEDAVYRITVAIPEMDLPAHRRGEFERDARRLTRRRASQAEWDDHHTRRREASVRVGSVTHQYVVVLAVNDEDRLAFSVSDENATWTVDVELSGGTLPVVQLQGRIDLTAMMRAEGSSGCATSLLGGVGVGSAMADFRTTGTGGRAVEADGHANRFRASVRLDINASITRWELVGVGTLRARGLGRVVLWLAGRRIRRGIDRSIADFWTSSGTHMDELDREVTRLRRAVEQAGGVARFVRRVLWDDDFDPGFDLFRLGSISGDQTTTNPNGPVDHTS